MELQHIDIGRLRPSPLNMRYGRKAPDVSDLLPSVRARGILQPLLVRPDGEDFEIVAGRRRYFAAKAVEGGSGLFLGYEPFHTSHTTSRCIVDVDRLDWGQPNRMGEFREIEQAFRRTCGDAEWCLSGTPLGPQTGWDT